MTWAASSVTTSSWSSAVFMAPSAQARGGGAEQSSTPSAPSWRDHRADTFTGEELEQQRVRHATVEDVRAGDALPQRGDARVDLRDHAFVERPRLAEPL